MVKAGRLSWRVRLRHSENRSKRRNDEKTFLDYAGLLPVAAIVAVSIFNVPVGTLGLFALLLLCPIGHLLLMRGMGHNGHHQEVANPDNATIEDIKKQG